MIGRAKVVVSFEIDFAIESENLETIKSEIKQRILDDANINFLDNSTSELTSFNLNSDSLDIEELEIYKTEFVKVE